MGRSLAMMSLLLLVGLALLHPASCAADQIRTSPALWSILTPRPSGAKSLDFDPVHIPLPDGVSGAESLAFDRRGQGPYAGVSDGRVLKWGGSTRGWTTFAHSAKYRENPRCTASAARSAETESICGRPLGLQFYAKTGDLYIADAYLGLMKVGPDGGEAKVLATQADGMPFNFVNGLDVDQATGDVYFTDSSTTYQRSSNTEILINRDTTGRLLKFDARTERVTVLKANLPYPNGVAVSGDRTHVVVVHTGPCQAFRYWLKGAKAGQYELLADLPGYPDNLRRDARGGYWVALNREKIQLNAAAPVKPHLVGVRIDANGAEHEELTAPRGVTLSDVAEKDGQLWLGSVELDYVGQVDYRSLHN